MGVWGMAPLSGAERGALDQEYRRAPSHLVRQRSQIVLLAAVVSTQKEVARAVRCSVATVGRTRALDRRGGRAALPRRPGSGRTTRRVSAVWEQALAAAVTQSPQACGLSRPTWTAPLLALYLARQTGEHVSERTVRRGLARLNLVCRRPRHTVRPKAEEAPDYGPKARGSRRC